MRLTRIGVLVCLLLMVQTLFAAIIGEERTVSLTLNDGLAGETVHSIMTDHNGTTWIATNSGVNAYNGKHLHTFRIYDNNRRMLVVDGLCETRSKTIYAATNGGLYRMQQGEASFERVLADKVGAVVSLLAVGDTIYIGSQQGFQYYDGHNLKHVDVSPSRRGLDNIVRQYVEGADGKIWFLSRFDLNCFDPRSGKLERYELSYQDQPVILTQFASADDSLFIICSRDKGLFTCDLRDRKLTPVSGVGNIVSTVQRSADGSICVATDGAGAYRLEVRGKGVEVSERFNTTGDNSHQLPSNGTYCYYRDMNGVNWFGFVRYGLAYTYHCGDLFRVAYAGDFTTDGMNVRTYCRHDQDAIIGTQNGFYHINTQTGMSRYFTSEDLGGGHIINAIVWYDDRFYIGTFDGGLRIYDPQTQQLAIPTFLMKLDKGSIGDLKVGPDGRLWIGCTHGLVIVSDGQVQQHFTEQNSRIVGGLILSITFDGEGNAWLTGAKGCSLYSVRSHEIVDTNFPKGFFNQEEWMRGAQGHDGLVFMRTGPKTFYTNQDMTDFGELKLPIAFYDKWCRNMVDDMKGHYLLATERGLFRFDYALKEMQHFGYGEGLRGNFINDMSIGSDGRVWVATSQGLFWTDADRLASWKKDNRYHVSLFNIRCGSDLLSHAEDYEANAKHRIRLRWNMTSEVLQVEPLLMDYAKQTGRLYEWRLDGADWQTVDAGDDIDVRGLMLGQHKLEVRLAGAQGTASTYTITVMPSFWATFELVLFIVAIALLWLWWRFRKNTKVLLSERDEIEDALMESERESEALREELADLSLTSEKYQKVKVDEEECADIVKRMKEYLERERVYTNADLKMKDLADVLHLSAPKLSQVFNLYMGQNYYDFINGYRLEEFKRLVEDGETRRYTITALSEQCGFKKSNFFSTFRKVEGMTPVEYLKKKGVKMT